MGAERTTYIPGDAGGLANQLGKLLARIVDDCDRYLACGRGWYPVLGELEERLSTIAPDCRLTAVTERDGKLTIELAYGAPGDDWTGAVRSAIIAAQARASRTCEFTGAPGVLMERDGRLRTLDPTTAPSGYRVVVPNDATGAARHLYEILRSVHDARQPR